MNKEDLLKYKRFLETLSVEEKKLRDKYLYQLAKGEILGPPTGYASIDKPWLKYYDLDKKTKFLNKTAYQSLEVNNKDNLNSVAIEYFYSKITFKELLNNIDKTAKSLEANGIKKGDFVTVCAPGIPETVYVFYALSKLGAVANMIAPHFNKQDFIDRIADCNSKLLIVMSDFYNEIKDAVKESNIEKIVIVPILNSSLLKFISKKYNIANNENEVFWNDFIKEAKHRKVSKTVEYEPNMPLTMVYSSGTTGAAKGILLSNDSFQNSINSYFKSGLDISKGQKFYQIIPTWYSTGISTSVHLPLTCGASVYMDPRFERDIFVKNILKAKPNYSLAPTSMYEALLESSLLKNKDLSYLRNAFEGGEPLSKDLAIRINKVFSEHGNHSSIKVGYGQCECGATITTQTDLTELCNGSVGVPLPDLNLQICDNDFNEVITGNRGHIVVDTPSSMIGYYKNVKASSEYFFTDINGKKWNCTGDIGYLDNNGNLYVEGRASDYSIINGEKIYNFDIEKIISNIHGIKLCDILSIKDEENKEHLVAHLILEENNSDDEKIIFENIQKEIYNITNNKNMVPVIFKIRKEFPYAKSGKRDTIKMKNEKDGLIYFDGYSVEKQYVKKSI